MGNEGLRGVAGVGSVSVSLDAHEATVRWQAEVAPNEAAAVQAVEQEGFGAQGVALGEGGQAGHGISGWGFNLWVGLPVTALLMLGAWVFGLGIVRWFQWGSFALAGGGPGSPGGLLS